MTTLNVDAESVAAPEASRYASSPCSWHEADPSYCGFLNKSELVELLNNLLEGERAGARGLNDMVRDVSDLRLNELLASIARDEANCCAVLVRQLKRLGVRPSRKIGRFCSRLKTRVSIAEKMALLERGQNQVVEMLNHTLARIEDPNLHADLTYMRDLHVQNIARAAEYTHCKTGR